MKVKRAFLASALFTVFFSSSVFCPSASARATMGGIGEYLNFTIHATDEAKIGENIVVDMTFTSGYDFVDVSPRNYFISIETLTALFNGANVTCYKTWKNVKLRSWESIHDNVTLMPSMEGSILCEVWGRYNYTYEGSDTVGFSWGGVTFPLTTVKAVTYSELWNSRNLLYTLTYILTLTTITFIATTVYFARREKIRTPTH